MRKLSDINENVLTDIIDRSRTGVSRKEDILHPTNRYELKNIITSEYKKQGKNLDLRHIDVSEINEIPGIFFNIKGLETIDVTGWNVSNVKYMYSLFYNCSSLKEIKGIENWDVSKVTNMAYMFDNCLSLEHLDLSGWNTGSVENMNSMFCDCKLLKEIKGIENWDVSKVTNMAYMFDNCLSLEHLDLSGWDTGSVENMDCMFCDCKNLKEIKGIENWDVSNVMDVNYMFDNCGTSYKLKNKTLIKENVLTDIIDRSRKSGSLRKEDILHPENNNELTDIIKSEYEKQGKNLDLRHIDVSGIKNMTHLFHFDNKIETIDVTGWNTSNVFSLYAIFYGCIYLKEIKGIENWDVRKVESMAFMFSHCSSLEYLDLSRWNTCSVEDMYHMFFNCRYLKKIKGIENWDVSKVTNNIEDMFYGCGVSYTLKNKKLIKENVLTDIIDRSRGLGKRMEERNRFDKAFDIIKKSDLIDMGGRCLWTSFNFGSDSIDKPGDYLSMDDMIELSDYLEGTGYRIPNKEDWTELVSLDMKMEQRDIYDSIMISNNDNIIHITNFGDYIENKFRKSENCRFIYYGMTFPYLNYGCVHIRKQNDGFVTTFTANMHDDDGFQVRLVKEK